MELGEEGRGGAAGQLRALPYIDMKDHLQAVCHMCSRESCSGLHGQCNPEDDGLVFKRMAPKGRNSS